MRVHARIELHRKIRWNLNVRENACRESRGEDGEHAAVRRHQNAFDEKQTDHANVFGFGKAVPQSSNGAMYKNTMVVLYLTDFQWFTDSLTLARGLQS